MVCICADMDTVINYLTKDEQRHGRLTDEFGKIPGALLAKEFYSGMVLKFTPDRSGLNEMLGCPQDEPKYYIIHTFNLLSGSFFSK